MIKIAHIYNYNLHFIIDTMGNPTVFYKEKLKFLWKCKKCNNAKEFEEDWRIDINQDLDYISQEYLLVDSNNIRCKLCGSVEIEEVETGGN